MSSLGTLGLHSQAVEPVRGDVDSGSFLWVASAAVIVLAAAVFYGRPLWEPARPNEDLAFSASDSKGRMRVNWNRNSPLIEGAESGRLDVVDGTNVASYPVDASVLRAGTLEYIRHSADVLLTLNMLRNGQVMHREMIRSIGYEPATDATPARGTRSRRR